MPYANTPTRPRSYRQVGAMSLPSAAETTAGYIIHAAGAIATFFVLWLFGRQWLIVDVTPYIGFNPTGLTSFPVLCILAWASMWALIGGYNYSIHDKETTVTRAVWLSMNAGFWEELIYRGFMFASAAALIPLINFIFGGFVGLDLVYWFYQHISIPLANFVTLGQMSDYLFTTNWLVGAALVSAAGKFSDAHEHLGIIGRVNSWFIGMVMFWVMFSYGIITAMVAHAVYDIIIIGTRAMKSEQVGLSWVR